MGNTDEQVYRIAVGAPAKRRSGVYRIFAPHARRGHSDVYVALRRLGGEFKISLHGSRSHLPPRGHLAVTEATQRTIGLPSRFLVTWPRANRADRGFDPEFQIVIPTSELREEGDEEDDFADVAWLEPAPAAGAIQICLVLTDPRVGESWPGELLGTTFLSRFELADGTSCWIVSKIWPELPGPFRERINDATRRLRSTEPEFLLGDPAFEDPNTRAILVGQDADGRIAAWLEIDLGKPHSEAA